MNKPFLTLIKKQEQKIIQSFSDDKEVWQDLITVGVAYKKKLYPLLE